MKRVYLAAPHTDDAFRAEATKLLRRKDITVLDPIAARDFRNKEIDNERAIVHGDLAEVAISDVILGNYSVPGWGTAMETWFAHAKGKPIVAYVDPTARVSPWIAYVAGGWSNVHRSLREACDAVLARHT